MAVRRVVTGQTAEGKAVVVSDEQLEPITATLLPGGGFYPLWGADKPLQLPQDGSRPSTTGWFPPADGFRFGVVVFGPEGAATPDIDMDSAIAELAERVPGLVETLEPDNPAMHRTDTIDFNVILSGELVLELDDGQETVVRAGDCIIQNGTRHGWHNRTSEPCVVAVALVGAGR